MGFTGRRTWTRARGLALASMMLASAAAAVAAEPQSPRLDRAKDYIVDERWVRAIAELKAAADDKKERSRDEALFWLAHCHKEAGDPASALLAINRLEHEFPRSRWIGPSRSLRIELAQRLNRTDVLWLTAVPPAPAVAPTPAPTIIEPAHPTPPPVHVAPPPLPPLPAPRNPRPATSSRAPTVVTPAPPPSPVWMPMPLVDPDLELRIQALGSLILTDSAEAAKVIPILRDIALESGSPGPARRALFALAQSRLPEARSTVVEVAKTAPESVQIEAVRVLGRLRGPEISTTLMNVYVGAAEPVKYQIVTSFGHRAETSSLLRIVKSEGNEQIRHTAIVTLGRAPGGKEHLRRMYETASASMKRPIIVGLFNARDDEGLIHIATRERQAALRQDVFERLRLLGTDRATRYLLQVRDRREK